MNVLFILFVLIILFIILFIIIIYTRVHITFHYNHKKDYNQLDVQLKFWKIIKIEREIPLEVEEEEDGDTKVKIKIEKNDNNEKKHTFSLEKIVKRLKDFEKLIRTILKSLPVIVKFTKKIRVHSFQWKTYIGSTDASLTGIAIGSLWAIKGSMVGAIGQFTKLLNYPNLSITPVFQRNIFETNIQCMISFRIGQAIYAILKIVRQKNQQEK
ncbi:hypothetical protein HNQ94_000540 [Salirhabdus euzebyi]|uniref:DUF2953 domain-containing protein n=1 Tax=Salirhabdus euzebyi TaxID=394506 RepID=A0A841PTG8_9BACI|nr:DUF2953 domain-containing protein [Salirhabdus euzebyi]MBB6452119.1 hypothetical protein [Salirhabdus euzebyi]